MPLSDREQRLLEQMERALYAEDPRFATTISKSGQGPLARGQRRWLVLGALIALGGVVLIVVSIAVSVLPLGILGFLGLVGGAALAVEGGRRAPAAEAGEPAGAAGTASRRRAAPPAGGGFVQRMEERWQRRNEGESTQD